MPAAPVDGGAGVERASARAADDAPVVAAPLELVVLAVPVTTVHGRLLDQGGHPVAGVVRASQWDGEGKLGPGVLGHAGADGRFELSPSRPGIHQIVADAGEHGTASLLDVDLGRGAHEPVELCVCGPGVVRGRVLDAGGKPAAAVELLVLLAALDDERGSFVLPEPARSAAEIEGRGRIWATLLTDADGAFEARGLREDRYVVRARTGASGG